MLLEDFGDFIYAYDPILFPADPQQSFFPAVSLELRVKANILLGRA